MDQGVLQQFLTSPGTNPNPNPILILIMIPLLSRHRMTAPKLWKTPYGNTSPNGVNWRM